MAVKYFLYSSEELNFRKEVEAKMGRRFVAGHVIIYGTKKPFTSLSSTSTSARYPDSKVVASGEISMMKYTMPEGR